MDGDQLWYILAKWENIGDELETVVCNVRIIS